MNINEYIEKFHIDFDFFEKTYENLPIKILKYLRDIDRGVFVEVGAHNGIFQSNTKILEDCGWSGLVIEPSFLLYQECKKNRKCFIENYALVSDKFVGDTILSDNMGKMINEKSGIFSMGPEKKGVCPAISFNNLNQKYGFTKIDFMSIDVEGYELEVLDGIDFNRLEINFLLIEVNSNFYNLNDIQKRLVNYDFNNPINISNFTRENCPTWPGNHQDYLFIKK